MQLVAMEDNAELAGTDSSKEEHDRSLAGNKPCGSLAMSGTVPH